MFGQSVNSLLLELAPLTQSLLDTIGYTSTALENLLTEKAEIVFSYLPKKYQDIYLGRVHDVVIVKRALAGQTSVKAPFAGMSNIYSESVDVSVNGANLTFPALNKGDKLVIDFDVDMSSNPKVDALCWATQTLAAIDVLAVVVESQGGSSSLGRVEMDNRRVWEWLDGLNNIRDGRVSRFRIRQLEYEIDAKSFSDNFDASFQQEIEGL